MYKSFNVLFPDAFKPDLPPPRVLLVDDQMMNILALREIFKADCEVFMATNGQQALEQANALLPDIILLDVVMDDMDGYTVCEKLKSNPLTSSIPVIFVTSHFDEADEVRGFELGGVDFIHKPINAVITKVRVANQIALKRQTDMLHSISLIDDLTGIANRRQFNQNMQLHWRQASRDKSPFSLILIDVDFFKFYNDHYGHPEGDACLRQIAQAIQRSVQRPYDLVARYGGEEFACILPKTDADGAAFIASQIQENVHKLAIPHAKSEVSNLVTVSMGVVCTIPGTVMQESAELIIATDKQLYKAKSNGRNRMCVQVLD